MAKRPIKTRIDRHKDLGPLHDLLLKSTVPDRTGKKSITVLAKALGFTTWGCYLWIKKNRVPPHMAKKIVTIHEKHADRVGLREKDRVSVRDFDPYTYG